MKILLISHDNRRKVLVQHPFRDSQQLTFKSDPLQIPLHFFPRSLAPRALSSLEIICWFGMAFPDSYSWIIWGFSFIIYTRKKQGSVLRTRLKNLHTRMHAHVCACVCTCTHAQRDLSQLSLSKFLIHPSLHDGFLQFSWYSII